MLFLGKAMKILNRSNDYELEILIRTTLKGGSTFGFRAYIDLDNIEEGWSLSFEINQSSDMAEDLNKGEKIEVLRLLKAIWTRFEKFPCCCCAYSKAHTLAYRKLGFEGEEYMFYVPQ